VSKVSVKVDVPYPISAAEQLWYDTDRWAGWIDGFQTVNQVEGDWPRSGSKVIWETAPGGRGRVTETVVRHEARVMCATAVADGQLEGLQTIRFAPRDAGGATIRLELEYTISDRTPFTPLVDLFFVRRTQRESLQRTLRRFALELRDEHDPPI
jgi:uncharacterized membrane protein